MQDGRVKWFSPVKGYGFIRVDGVSEDVFVHFSAIRKDGYKSLNEDDPVRLELVWGQKGPQAMDVQPLGAETLSAAGSA